MNYPPEYFPATYLVLDVETTGFSHRKDYIAQFGLAKVVERELVYQTGFIIHVPKDSMSEGATGSHGLTEEICNRDGVPREEAMNTIHGILTSWHETNPNDPIVGHNLAKFDLPFIEQEFERFNLVFDLDVFPMVDTGAMVKAMQIGTYPTPGEPQKQFMLRMLNYRAKGVMWALEKYCIDRYGLREKTASMDSHNAQNDCVITHWVLEEIYKEWSESGGNDKTSGERGGPQARGSDARTRRRKPAPHPGHP